MKSTWIFLVVVMFTLTSFQPAAKSPFSGTWKETWAVGQESDVSYQDVYEVSGKTKNLLIRCTSHANYKFENIRIKGRNIRFDLINDTYRLPYDLTLQPGNKTMKGKATGITNETVPILWEKQP